MSLDYRPLTGVPDETLHACFLEAFSDYAVPVRTTLESFLENNALRGFDPSVSPGAFEDGKLVGFIFNGRGGWQGLPTAYDLGTGVVLSRRGGGIARALARESFSLLKRAGTAQYLLEVITTNTPALNLYKKEGFGITREFSCFRGPRAALKTSPAPGGAELRQLGPGDLKAAAAFRDWEPSWQNSDESLRRFPGKLTLLGVFAGGELAGYGAVKPNGDIPQLAVAKKFRRRGLGAFLLSGLAAALPPDRDRLSCLNIESSDQASQAFFPARGLPLFAGQYEMIKSLK